MVQKSVLNEEEGRELTENELLAICGGAGGSSNVSGWPNWFAAPQTSHGKSAKAHASKNDFAQGFEQLQNLTSALVGTIL